MLLRNLAARASSYMAAALCFRAVFSGWMTGGAKLRPPAGFRLGGRVGGLSVMDSGAVVVVFPSSAPPGLISVFRASCGPGEELRSGHAISRGWGTRAS